MEPDPDLEADVAMALRLQAEFYRIEPQLKALRKRIGDKLGGGKHRVGEATIDVVISKRSVPDRARLKAMLGDNWPEFCKFSVVRQVLIRERGKSMRRGIDVGRSDLTEEEADAYKAELDGRGET